MREDATVDDFIDVVESNRAYLPCLYVYNKIDQLSIEEVDAIARRPHTAVVRYAVYLHRDDATQLVIFEAAT